MTSRITRRPALVVGLTMFVVVWTLTTHGKYSADGDEPHYLMVTQSLWADHDIDLANNYGANDGRLFGHDQLEAGAHARVDRRQRLSPVHDLGVSIALLPSYAVAQPIAALMPESLLERVRMTRGLFAYSLISLTLLAACSTAGGLLARSLARTTTPTNAILTTLLVGLSPPVLCHSFLIYPEVFGFIAACAVVCWALSGNPSMRSAWPLVAALGLLPWCHRKFSFFVFACAVVMLVRHAAFWRERSARDRGVLALLFLVPQVAMHAWTLYTWGTLGGPQMLDTLPFTVSGAPRGLLGLLFDRQYGLVAGAPWYALLPAAWRLAGRRAALFLLPVVALAAPMAAFVVWWGGFSPAARYLVPVLPFCVAAVAWSVERPLFRRVVLLGAAVQLPITAYAWQHPRSLWPVGISNPLLDALGPIGRGYEYLLPPLTNGEPIVPAVAVAAATIAFNVLLVVIAVRGGRLQADLAKSG